MPPTPGLPGHPRAHRICFCARCVEQPQVRILVALAHGLLGWHLQSALTACVGHHKCVWYCRRGHSEAE